MEKALEHGASVIMVNNWDRITGKLYPKQAMAVRHLIPDQASRVHLVLAVLGCYPTICNQHGFRVTQLLFT